MAMTVGYAWLAAPVRANALGAPPACAIAGAPGAAAWTAGPTSSASDIGAVRAACEPSLVPVTSYGRAFAQPLLAATNQAQAIFLPNGDTVAQLAIPRAAPSEPGPYAYASYMVQEIAPGGQVLWRIRVSGPGNLAAGPRVLALQTGGQLLVGDLATHRDTWMRAGGWNVSYQLAVAGSLVVLLRTDWPGWSRAKRPTVTLITPGGRVRRRVTLATPVFGADMAADGHAAYVVSGDTLFRVAASGRIEGPFRLGASYDQLSVVATGEVLLRSRNCTSLVRVGRGGVSTLWTLPVPEYDTIAGAGPLVVAGSAISSSVSPFPYLAVWDTRGDRVVGRIAQPGKLLTPLAAGPFGVVALATECPSVRTACSLPNGAEQAPDKLELFPADLSATPIWSHDVCANRWIGWQPGAAWTYHLSNATFLTTPCAPGMAVIWSGTISQAVTPGSTAAYLPTGLEPQLPPLMPGPVASYAVFAKAVRIDAAHPLVITAATAGKPVPVTVSAVIAKGVPVASPSVVLVKPGDSGAGGRFSFSPANPGGALMLTAGDRGEAITYTNDRPGRYVLTATPIDLDYYSGTVQVAAPPGLLAGAPFKVLTRVTDDNGVLARPNPGSVMAAAPGSDILGVATQPLGTRPHGRYAARFKAGGSTGNVTVGLGVRPNAGQPASVAVGVTVPVANVLAPVVRVAAAVGGPALEITARPGGDPPVGFLVFRAGPSGDVPPIGSGALSGALAMAPYTGRPVALPLGGSLPATGTYYVVALDADGVASAAAVAGG